MRCPDCNKFVAYGDIEVEEQNCDINDNYIEGEVRVVLPCAECSTELKEYSFEISEEIIHECSPELYADYQETLDPSEKTSEEEDPEYELVSSDNWNPADRFQDTDKHGKKIKNTRYMKHFYGFEGSVTVKCLKCGEEFEVNIAQDEQASAFEECC